MKTNKFVVLLLAIIIVTNASPVFAGGRRDIHNRGGNNPTPVPMPVPTPTPDPMPVPTPTPAPAYGGPKSPSPKPPKHDPRHPKTTPANRITLEEIGWLQLAAHDLFNTNRSTGIDTENGKLDLSAIFDHGDAAIATGGDPRNVSNPIVLSVTMDLVAGYQRRIAAGLAPAVARQQVVDHFLQVLAPSYRDAFGESFPTPQAGTVTHTEDLALRTLHDYLPGNIKVNGRNRSIFDPSIQGVILSTNDLQQKSSPLDGTYDQAFLDIGLLGLDSSFGTQFNAEHPFEEFLTEISGGSYPSDSVVMTYIRSVFAKGLAN